MQAVRAFGKRLIYNPQLLRSSTAVAKAHVRQYLRRTKSGKLVTIKDHEDSRKQHKHTVKSQPKPMTSKQGNYMYDLLGFSQFREIKKELLKRFDPASGWTDLSSSTASRIITGINEYWDNPKNRKVILFNIQKLLSKNMEN